MSGFIQSYFQQQKDADHARKIMYYFPPEKLPVLSTLARSFAVFNGWFSSIPGPTICNRAFAHYGTSFGNVDMNMFLFPTAKKNKIARFNLLFSAVKSIAGEGIDDDLAINANRLGHSLAHGDILGRMFGNKQF